MEAVAKAKYLHCSAQKMRLVADLVRNTKVDSAIARLYALSKTKKSARMIDKVLKSAIANIKEMNTDIHVETDNLSISSITVDAGPHVKRIRPRAQGRAFRIQKNLCHLTISISD